MKLGLGVAQLLIALIAVMAPIIITLGNFAFLLSSDSYLHSLYSSTATLYNSQPQMQPEIAAAVSADVIAYIRGDEQQLQYAYYFSPEEISHLADVRSRVSASFAALYILVAAVAVSLFGLYASCRKFNAFPSRLAAKIGSSRLRIPPGGIATGLSHAKHDLGAAAVKTALMRGGIATVALAALLFLASLGFGSAFTSFHTVVFPNSQWQFPSYYLLVNLFTEEFFAGFAKDVVVGSLIQGVALAVFAATAGRLYDAYRLAKR